MAEADTDHVRLDQAHLLISAGQYGQAMRILDPYLATCPDDTTALCLAASALVELAGSRRAVRLTERAIALVPEDSWPYRIQATAYNRLRQQDLAQRAARAAVRVEPDEWRSHYLSAVSDLWTGGATEATLARIEQARTLEPEQAEIQRMYGLIADQLGHRREAAAAYSAALRLEPDHAAALEDLARLHLNSHRFSSALAAFGSAGRLDPTLDGLTDGVERLLVKFEGLARYPILLALTATGFWPRPAAVVTVLALGLIGWRLWRAGRRTLMTLGPTILRHNAELAAWSVGLLLSLLVVLVNGGLGRRFTPNPSHDSFSWGWHPIFPLLAVAATIFYIKKPLPFSRLLRQRGVQVKIRR